MEEGPLYGKVGKAKQEVGESSTRQRRMIFICDEVLSYHKLRCVYNNSALHYWVSTAAGLIGSYILLCKVYLDFPSVKASKLSSHGSSSTATCL